MKTKSQYRKIPSTLPRGKACFSPWTGWLFCFFPILCESGRGLNVQPTNFPCYWGPYFCKCQKWDLGNFSALSSVWLIARTISSPYFSPLQRCLDNTGVLCCQQLLPIPQLGDSLLPSSVSLFSSAVLCTLWGVCSLCSVSATGSSSAAVFHMGFGSIGVFLTSKGRLRCVFS